ncbi:MAG: hypothetical protein AAFR26_15110 [Cyanobacteria bacterium J06626_4]
MTLAAIAPRQTLKTAAASRAAMPGIQVIFRAMVGGAIATPAFNFFALRIGRYMRVIQIKNIPPEEPGFYEKLAVNC